MIRVSKIIVALSITISISCCNHANDKIHTNCSGYFRNVDLKQLKGIDPLTNKQNPCIYFHKSDSIITLFYYMAEGLDLKLYLNKTNNSLDTNSKIFESVFRHDRIDHIYVDKWFLKDSILHNEIGILFKPDTSNRIVNRSKFIGNKSYFTSSCSSEKLTSKNEMNSCLDNFHFISYHVVGDTLKVQNSKSELTAKAKIGEKFCLWQAMLFERTDIEELKYSNRID